MLIVYQPQIGFEAESNVGNGLLAISKANLTGSFGENGPTGIHELDPALEQKARPNT